LRAADGVPQMVAWEWQGHEGLHYTHSQKCVHPCNTISARSAQRFGNTKHLRWDNSKLPRAVSRFIFRLYM
jgi:hypothetical protein